MGMAASQARLLTITARLADNELRSQTINNAKMRLSTESSQASENYISALNDATLKFSNYDTDGNALSQTLTYNTLTAYSSYNTQYGLVNSSGQILVSESEAALFEASGENLTAYLKSHGLEYTTTYFDELGTLTNDSYPEPYNSIDAETLQEYYEAYGSYENSIEVENYETYYSDFKSASTLLTTASKSLISRYLTSSAVSDGNIGYSSGAYSYTNLTSSSYDSTSYDTVKNTLSSIITFLASEDINLISSDDASYYDELLDSYYYGTSTYGSCTGLISSDTASITAVTDDDDNITYTDEDGSTVSLKTLYEYTDDGNTIAYYYYTQDSDGNYIQTTILTDPETAADEINDLVDYIMSSLADYDINYENFAEWLLENEDNDEILSDYGIDLSGDIESVGQTLSDVLDAYTLAKDTFLGFIFDEDSVKTIKNMIENNELDIASLTDIDTVLQLLVDYGLTQSSSYDTVIKEYIIDAMIEEYGEPAYAWVDSTDTNNTGNADAKAQWYTNLFNRMMQGYKTIEDGLASSQEWIEYALESGIVTLEQVDSSYNWVSLDYSSCTMITEETDSDAVAKAEAEYNRAMNDIEAKDSIYDIELKNIDTEHSSLQTEYESIQSVISKNIERTFKFDQSG